MSNCEWELQKAVYARLIADSSLIEVITGIYDHVPQNTAFPYVVLKEMASRDRSSLGSVITEIQMHIAVYTRERGSKTVLAIIDKIRLRLHHAVLTVTGYTSYPIVFISSNYQQSPDGLTYRGEIEFHACIEG